MAQDIKDDIISAVTSWHLHKAEVATAVFDASNPARMRDFTDRLNTASREVLAALGITNPDVWESFVEVVTNARSLVSVGKRQ